MESNRNKSNVNFPGLAGEDLVLLSKAGGEFPIPVSASTTIRYADEGIRGNMLGTVLLGGRRYTSRQEIVRWVTRSTTTLGDDNAITAPVNSPKKQVIESGRKKFGLPPSGRDGEIAE